MAKKDILIRKLQLQIPQLALFLGLCSSALMASAQQPQLEIWPGKPPGRQAAQGEEADQSKPKTQLVAGKEVIRLGNVSTPMLTIYSPPEGKNTGAAVVVCPGGGYHILAYDLEGTEVCQWLQSIGVTGILLKYRVPKPAGDSRPIEPLQDVQRTMSLVRAGAAQWGIDPERIGVLGFSAGGHLSARLSTNYATRAYSAVDASDEVSCRPDFTILVYPAYLYEKENDAELLSPMMPVDENTPPMFLTMAFDDPVGPENILRMGLALKKAKVPAEVHMYPTGGHGYGLRPNPHQATSWPKRCEQWLDASGWLGQD